MKVITWKYLMNIKDAVFNPKKSGAIKIVPFDVVILNDRIRKGSMAKLVSKMEVDDITVAPSDKMRKALLAYTNKYYGKGCFKTRIVKGTETYRCERIK